MDIYKCSEKNLFMVYIYGYIMVVIVSRLIFVTEEVSFGSQFFNFMCLKDVQMS